MDKQNPLSPQWKNTLKSHSQAAKDVQKSTLAQQKLHKRHKYQLALALLVACLITAGANSGWLRSFDYVLADSLYQSADHFNEDILVIGIDSYALGELGSWPWDRSVMADIVSTLNADPDNQPAAIGVDVLYVMENDPWADSYLVDTLAPMDNVVLATGVEFTTSLQLDDDGIGYMDDTAVSAYESPFPALQAVVPTGHVNVMYDSDGILRHHLWSVPSEDGGQTLSLPYQLYTLYCDVHGLEAEFLPTTSQDGFWWLDFSATPNSFYAYSAADILYGEFDSSVLKDAIVLIGPYNAGLSDDYLTAVDHTQNMYGVEYLANVTNAMLRGADKTEVSITLQLVLLFAFSFGCVLLLSAIAMGWSWLVMLALMGGALGVCIWGYDYGNFVLLPLWPLVAIVFAWVISMAEHYSLARLEQRRISQTFGHYVDPSILKELLKGDTQALDLGGRTVDIAVLFVDIRGFTTMSEKLPPEDVVEILNSYLTLTSQSIKKTHGTLDKFIGDCTMAFWGAPLPCQDPIYSACQAAMAMVDGAKELEHHMFAKYGQTVSFGIGVHYGPAVVGNIGAVDRMDYTAIGDTVNTSSRLEANAPAGTIYISRTVADTLGHRASITPLATPLKLKGKEEGFDIFTLDALI